MMTQTQNPVYVSLEFTPNPNTLKYSVNRVLLEKGSRQFSTRESAIQNSDLATRLFSIQGISGVMIGRDFVTITKTESGDWDQVHTATSKTIQEYIESGLPVVELVNTADAVTGVGAFPEIERKILEILDRDIRPAVAMDGGDITFNSFQDGVVFLQLKGACSGCPSSTMTLKMGIETRLKDQIPEVREVQAI